MINILDESVVSRLLQETEGSENRNRKIQAWSAYRISHGDILPYVTDEVAKVLPKSWKQMRMSDISISEKVNKKLSNAYKEPPLRTIPDSEAETESLQNLYKDMRVDQKFSEFDFISNVNRYSLMWVNYRVGTGLQFVPLHPFEFDVVRDKKDGSLEAVILSYPDATITQSTPYDELSSPDSVNQAIANHPADTSSQKRRYAIWTKEHHVSVLASVKRLGNQVEVSLQFEEMANNPNNVNPLGMLPFVYYSKDDGGNPTDYPLTNPITRQAVFYNVLNSDLLSAASLQGYGIRTISATQEILNSMQVLHEGLTTAVELPQNEDSTLPKTELAFVNPSPDLAGQKDTYQSYLIQVLSQHGINGGSVINGDTEGFSSGIDRAIANADVQNIVKSNQVGYQDVEICCFKIIKAWQDEVIGDIKFAPDSDLSIIYPRPQILISDAETLANIEKRLALGLIKKSAALMILNPNLSQSEADKELEEIKGEKVANANSFFQTPEVIDGSDIQED